MLGMLSMRSSWNESETGMTIDWIYSFLNWLIDNTCSIFYNWNSIFKRNSIGISGFCNAAVSSVSDYCKLSSQWHRSHLVALWRARQRLRPKPRTSTIKYNIMCVWWCPKSASKRSIPEWPYSLLFLLFHNCIVRNIAFPLCEKAKERSGRSVRGRMKRREESKKKRELWKRETRRKETTVVEYCNSVLPVIELSRSP